MSVALVRFAEIVSRIEQHRSLGCRLGKIRVSDWQSKLAIVRGASIIGPSTTTTAAATAAAAAAATTATTTMMTTTTTTRRGEGRGARVNSKKGGASEPADLSRRGELRMCSFDLGRAPMHPESTLARSSRIHTTWCGAGRARGLPTKRANLRN
jgi:hypothetical protein